MKRSHNGAGASTSQVTANPLSDSLPVPPVRCRTVCVSKLLRTAEGPAAGISRHRILGHRLDTDVRGVIRHPEATEWIRAPEFADDRWLQLYEWVRALELVRIPAIVDGMSAAILYGFPLPTRTGLGPLHIIVRPGVNRTLLRNVKTRRSEFVDGHPWFGLTVNAPLLVLLGLAGQLREHELTAMVDGLTGTFHGAEMCTVAQLKGWLAEKRRIRGIRVLRAAADRARDGARSPKETEWRLRIVDAGMPEPTVNLSVWTTPNQRREIDLAIEEYKIAVEYHGREYHLRTSLQIAEDNQRRLELERLGWKVIVVTSERSVGAQLAEIRQELMTRGWRP